MSKLQIGLSLASAVPAALVDPGSVGPMHLIPAERCVGRFLFRRTIGRTRFEDLDGFCIFNHLPIRLRGHRASQLLRLANATVPPYRTIQI
jgi:hypothetical protein